MDTSTSPHRARGGRLARSRPRCKLPVMRAFLPPLLLLAACGADSEPEPESNLQHEAAAPRPAPSPPVRPAESEETKQASADAGAVLRRYYDLIEAGDYEAAWRMRGHGEEGAEAFAKNFAAYERYRVVLGPATRPVAANGWLYVEVPIQITGRMKGGKPFGSVGSVTMRRPSPGAGRESEGWRIYTG